VQRLRTWPEASPDPYRSLTSLERFVLWSKLRSGHRRAVRAALRSRSIRQIGSTVRLVNDLAILQYDVDWNDVT
jgi:hypothetical protein